MNLQSARTQLFEIIFGTQTRAGRYYDISLIIAILLSVVVVVIDSVEGFNSEFESVLWSLEWGFTLLFTAEYLLRLWISPKPLAYARSFFGVVDLLAVLPSYLALLVAGAQYLLLIRLLRVLRIFRVLKLVRYLGEANVLIRSLVQSKRKILVFFLSVGVLIVLFGALMFAIEGPEHGFTSIPISIYWAVVTLTTVGYGDISPQTPLGQAVAALVMLTGYAILAVPTGIVTAELSTEILRQRSLTRCTQCERGGHEADAEFCKFCGSELPEPLIKDNPHS
ncbi:MULTISPECIES: ion transporter [Corallincola]|uniref:Ion transporter n=2 Tax=Corallincola TaxID=1775176 RepID=A0A368NHS9_9GAMM|nr:MULTISPECIES: ion transporter [Corallincola]RCU50018.1 ion transporter [Corallincola holothuriorum]TAA45001.1 ion transporter [Corallincola spongiicola]